MNYIWYVIGVLLLGWVAWDLYFGYTLLHTFVYRDEEPTLYWIAVGVWTLLGISCFFSWHRE